MGIQTLVVFVGVAMALVLGITTAAWGASLRAAGWIAIGFGSIMWALLHLIEWLIGREIWHYSAPYPYRWMDAAPTHDAPAAATEHERHEADEGWQSVAAA
jgi:hypothetical protein